MAPRRYLVTTASTQAEALRWAKEGAVHGSRVVAGSQTEGVGRLDHAWSSPAGGLYLSMILRDLTRPSSLFPLLVGAQLRERLRSRWSIVTAVKWPNDLVVPGPTARYRKLAGVLVDRVAPMEADPKIVIGLGINVASPASRFPAGLRPSVVGLDEIAQSPPTLADVEEVAAGATESAWTIAESVDPSGPLLSDLRSSLFGVGQRARVDGRPVGRIRGVDFDGALLVEEAGHTDRILAGSLTIEEAS
ncbi:MAG: biotin--[acetyl-CoA-carboxylase] ligase [Thermoplasmata archaeon]